MATTITRAMRFFYEAFCGICMRSTQHESGRCTVCMPVTQRTSFKLVLTVPVEAELE
jgi:hypothetical protein